MNKVVGTITTTNRQILVGDHHIVVDVPVATGEANITMGTLLYRDDGDYKALALADIATVDPVAVALEDMTGTADDSVIVAALHGAVIAEKLTFKDGSAITEDAAVALQAAGIYALGKVEPNPVPASGGN